MKIIVVGGTGTLGRAVVRALGERHEVVSVGRTSDEHRVDITDTESVTALFKSIGSVDAIVSTAGSLHFGALADTTPEQFNQGLQDKLLGQVRLALIGQHYLNDGGSITLTSGIVAQEPIRNGSNATTVNAAIEAFATAAAVELPRGLRINVVSPTYVDESAEVYGPFFPGFESVPVAKVALAYVRSIEGPQTARTYRVW